MALLEFFLALVLLAGTYLSCRAIIYYEPGMTAHELLQRADEALYRCKNLPEPLCIYS